jgi:hypothetical protein
MAWLWASEPGIRLFQTYREVLKYGLIEIVLLLLSIAVLGAEATADDVDIANLVAMASPVREPVPPQFVQVSEEGTHFVLNGRPFFFAGANCYYLMVGPSCSCDCFGTAGF